MTKTQQFKRRGFDLTKYDRSSGYFRVRCSQCEVLVINGMATHEQGCPNIKRPRHATQEA